jgi:hypothetical protein
MAASSTAPSRPPWLSETARSAFDYRATGGNPEQPGSASHLGLPGFRTVLHDQPQESRVLRGTVGRILANSPPCYAELAIDDVFFQADVFSGAYLKTLVRFRRFDAGDTPTRTFGTIATEKLTQFPPAKSDADSRMLSPNCLRPLAKA